MKMMKHEMETCSRNKHPVELKIEEVRVDMQVEYIQIKFYTNIMVK